MYRTVHSEVLGWIVSRATGKHWAELMSDNIWQKLGTEEDAHVMVDSVGTPLQGAGLNATARDLARFGEMLRLGGSFNGQKIFDKAVIDDTAKGGEVLLPGYYVGERKGRTSVIEPETIVEELVEAGVSTGDILNACSFTADALTGLHGGVAAAHIVVGDSIKVLYKEKVKKGKK